MQAHALSATLGCALHGGPRLARRPAARRAQPARCVASSEPRPALSSAYTKVFVAGATGETGSAVVARLVAEGVAVRALVRDPGSAAARALPAVVEQVQGDVSDVPALVAAVKGCDAVICATGVRPSLDPTGPYRVDFVGTVNLVAAASKNRVKHFTLVTSIGADQLLFPLNLAWGVLFWKKLGEEELQRSGLRHTIIRPGGLRSQGVPAPVVVKAGGSYGLPPRPAPSGSILRSQVAELCVASLTAPAAANAVVEAVTDAAAPVMAPDALFEAALR